MTPHASRQRQQIAVGYIGKAWLFHFSYTLQSEHFTVTTAQYYIGRHMLQLSGERSNLWDVFTPTFF
jgi:hypothetical protein